MHTVLALVRLKQNPRPAQDTAPGHQDSQSHQDTSSRGEGNKTNCRHRPSAPNTEISHVSERERFCVCICLIEGVEHNVNTILHTRDLCSVCLKFVLLAFGQ